ncbi:hypothetical protein TNCT_373571 [Trichonephila clavata]|uniref:Retrotransposon gag domain-containing protein n=1 Tax=Trichonephila clavata TaxID=2740835 RepID=A0A8X6GRA3_TRICU|nr:hypothetical protein TNCT_373571 [Trichonephila clavata]
MAQSKLPIEIIPFFDGSKELIDNFFTQIKRVVKVNEWDFLTTQAILSARLNSPALTFFSTNPNCKNAKDIDEVETLFYDFFSEKTTELQRKLNFHNIQYYSGENIKNFAHRLETAAEYMLTQAQTKETKTITHSIIFSKFITSLPQNFQRKLSSKNPSTLKEAIDIAVEMQQNNETHTTCSMLLQPVKTVNTEQDSIIQKLDELTNQIAMLKTKQKAEILHRAPFKGLLGYDFLLRNRITLELNSNTPKFSDTTIPVIHNNCQGNLEDVSNPNFSASLNAILETPTKVESKYINNRKPNVNKTSKALIETPTHIKPMYSECKQIQNFKSKPLLPTPKVHSTNNTN